MIKYERWSNFTMQSQQIRKAINLRKELLALFSKLCIKINGIVTSLNLPAAPLLSYCYSCIAHVTVDPTFAHGLSRLFLYELETNKLYCPCYVPYSIKKTNGMTHTSNNDITASTICQPISFLNNTSSSEKSKHTSTRSNEWF